MEITKTPVVATVSEGLSALAARDYCNEKGYDIEELFSLTDCAFAVENGKYNYLICSELESARLQSFGLTYIEECNYKSQYSLCVSAENIELSQQLNSAIAALTENGTIDEILGSYMGEGTYTAPATAGNPLYIMFIDGASQYYDLNDDGEAEGLEVDIVAAVCNELGYTPVFISGAYDEGFDAVLNGEADMIMSVDAVNALLGDDFTLTSPYLTITYGVYGTQE